jgi:hypothetical protein
MVKTIGITFEYLFVATLVAGAENENVRRALQFGEDCH